MRPVRRHLFARAAVVLSGLLAAAGARAADPPLAELLDKLKSPSAEVRRRAARDLAGRVREETRLDPLERAATSDPDPRVRLEALQALSPSYIGIGRTPRWKALWVKSLRDAD